jgi:hypothetical protein
MKYVGRNGLLPLSDDTLGTGFEMRNYRSTPPVRDATGSRGSAENYGRMKAATAARN